MLQGSTAVAIQAVLAAVAFSALVGKRLRERPRRPSQTWLFDTSKQVVSMGAAHLCGIIIALLVHTHTSAPSECAWYFVAFSVDSTLGVALTVVLHVLILRALRDEHKSVSQEESWREAVCACGSYGDPPRFQRWAWQALEWTLCVVAARAVCGTLVGLAFARLFARLCNRV